MIEEVEFEDQTLALKITFEDSAFDGDLDSGEVKSEDSQPLMIHTLKLQKPRSRP